jgi:hypothetical protein
MTFLNTEQILFNIKNTLEHHKDSYVFIKNDYFGKTGNRIENLYFSDFDKISFDEN